MLDREEYVEQSYFFGTLLERLAQRMATQDLLASLRDEILATSKLPMAIDFLAGELRLTGAFAGAMGKLGHYFTPFQTFLVAEAENDRGRFDLRTALEILKREAAYRAEGASAGGIFLYEFESLCRNRLDYERGLDAMSGDTLFDDDWRKWILTVRRQIGLVDFADMLYVRSAYYHAQQARRGLSDAAPEPALFGEREGKIALAHRRKDPLMLFAALHRHLGYPEAPAPKPAGEDPQAISRLSRRMEKLEARLKLMEEDRKGALDISKYYVSPERDPTPDDEP